MSSSQPQGAPRRDASGSSPHSADPAPKRRGRAAASASRLKLNLKAKAETEDGGAFPSGLRLLSALLLTAALAAAGLLAFDAPLNAQASLSSESAALNVANPAAIPFAVTLILFLIGLQAFLSASEIALITLRKSRLRQLVEEGRPAARRVGKPAR